MAQKNWIVAFAPADDGLYQVTVRRSGSVHRFKTRLPPDISDMWMEAPEEQENTRTFRRKPDEPTPEERFYLAGNLPTLASIGERITEALFDTKENAEGIKVLGALEDRVADAEGIEIQLDLSQTPELSAIPWEAAYLRSKERFLACATNSNIVRRLDAQSDLPPPIEKPIRILVVAANPYKDLKTNVELGNIEKRIDKLIKRGADQYEIKTLPATTREEFRDTLADWQPHIIHYIGHSSFRDGMGYLYFENEEGGEEGSDRVSADTLRNMLINDRPWLVVLNSCESGATSKEQPMGGVAQSLLGRLNIPFVIGMQQPVSDDAAICFSRAFYGALTEDEHTIADAVTIGRNAISTQGDERTQVELITPALYTSGETDRIAFVEGAGTTAATAAAAASTEVTAPETFADRMKRVTENLNATKAFFIAALPFLALLLYVFDDVIPAPIKESFQGISQILTGSKDEAETGTKAAAGGTEDASQNNGSGNTSGTIVADETTGETLGVIVDERFFESRNSNRLARSGGNIGGQRSDFPNISGRPSPIAERSIPSVLTSSARDRSNIVSEQTLPDGRTLTVFSDGSMTEIFPDGLVRTTQPDGTVVQVRSRRMVRAYPTGGGVPATGGYSGGTPIQPPPLPYVSTTAPPPPSPGSYYSSMRIEGLQIPYCADERSTVLFGHGTALAMSFEQSLRPIETWSSVCDPQIIAVTGYATVDELDTNPQLAERRASLVADRVVAIVGEQRLDVEVNAAAFPVSDTQSPRDHSASIEFIPGPIDIDPERMVRIDFAHGEYALDAEAWARLRPFATRQEDGTFPSYRITSTLDPNLAPVHVSGEPGADVAEAPPPASRYAVAEWRARNVAFAVGELTEWRNAPKSARTLPNLERLQAACQAGIDCPDGAIIGGGQAGATITQQSATECAAPGTCQVAVYEYAQPLPPPPGAVFVELLDSTFAEVAANADAEYAPGLDDRYGEIPHMVSQESVESHSIEQGAEPGFVPQGNE